MVSIFPASESSARIISGGAWRVASRGNVRSRSRTELDKSVRTRTFPRTHPPRGIHWNAFLMKRSQLANLFIDTASQSPARRSLCSLSCALASFSAGHHFMPDQRLLSRPDLVARAYETFRSFDWAAPELAEMPNLVLSARRASSAIGVLTCQSCASSNCNRTGEVRRRSSETGKLKEFTPVGRSNASVYTTRVSPWADLTGS